jgi:thiol-disulfide isomerase/thioredoxin
MSAQTVTRKNRQTWTMITVGDSVKDGWETDPSCKWYTLCEDHEEIVFHDVLVNARDAATVPAMWCPKCREVLPMIANYKAKAGMK